MKHFITGYEKEKDEQIFKLKLPLMLAELKAIMVWSDEGACVFDHELTDEQIVKIEQGCKVQLPKHLDLFLSTESD